MEVPFVPSPDVSVALNALLDVLERRPSENGTRNTQHRSIKVTLTALPLPNYFSQTDPTPRLIANEQLQILERANLIQLTWLPGEKGHILQSVKLTEHATRNTLYTLLNRIPLANRRTHLEQLLLADKFRFQDDWRGRAINYILNQLKAEKSPAPFSLTDSNLTLDLLAVLQALPALTAETPYRVFSVRVFNNSKRLEAIKRQLVSLARLGNPEWKRIPAEEVLRELNLVANPNYIHLSGNWELTTEDGEILNLSGFTPSVGFPAAQTSSLRSVRAESVLCIENLTTFHQFTRQTEHATRNTQQALLCTYGNPSPAVRRVLRLLPESVPIYLWPDLDYGGFNILSQLRRTVGEQVQPYLMDIETLESNIRCARPLTASDRVNLKRLLLRSELRDVRPVIEHLLKRGLKLEQEAIYPPTT
ncbi:MAG: DUF2399 domain-containing protein [Chloroflexi bacterium]|nr:DUF2399 domain-containing protein [Chloroflexota bacterium]